MIAIYRQHPIASTDCSAAIRKVLAKRYNTCYVSNRTLTDKILNDAQTIVFPGGLGDVDAFDNMVKQHTSIIQDYVASGGCYLGICMGAYIASQLYFDLLGDVRSVQYVRTRDSLIHHERPTIIPCNWRGQLHNMYFYDGPSFQGDIAYNNVIASYTNNTPAAIYKDYGKGRVLAVGPHLESQRDWYGKRTQQYWHDGLHHDLLLDAIEDFLLINK
jgi:glutamine amidotransferase-like uncharacterized protein